MNNFKERVELVGGQKFIDKFIEEKKDEVKEHFLPRLRITYPIFEELEDEFRGCARGYTRVSKLESLFEWGLDQINSLKGEFSSSVEELMGFVMKHYLEETEGINVKIDNAFIEYEEKELCLKQFLSSILTNVHIDMTKEIDKGLIQFKGEHDTMDEGMNRVERIYKELYDLGLAQDITIYVIKLFNIYLEEAENNINDEM
jgi:hypothetical protein